MKKPTWVVVVGILGIIFSCFGILGAGNEIIMPKMMEFQREMFSNFETEMRKEMEREGEYDSDDNPLELFEFIWKMWDFPEWFGTFLIVGGVLKLFVCGFYLLASIFLLQLKPYSISLFYGAAGLSIVSGVIKGIVALSAGSFMGMAMMMGGMFGVVIDIVLVIVVVMGSKEAFYSHTPPPLRYGS